MAMTDKEQLRELVERLGDEQASELLRLANAVLDVPAPRRPRPSWVGALKSAEPDFAERSEEILRAEFGKNSS